MTPFDRHRTGEISDASLLRVIHDHMTSLSRGTGRTTKAVFRANKEDAVLVVHSAATKDYIRSKCHDHDIPIPKMIIARSMAEFERERSRQQTTKYVFDNAAQYAILQDMLNYYSGLFGDHVSRKTEGKPCGWMASDGECRYMPSDCHCEKHVKA